MSAECYWSLGSEGVGQSAGRRALWIPKWNSQILQRVAGSFPECMWFVSIIFFGKKISQILTDPSKRYWSVPLFFQRSTTKWQFFYTSSIRGSLTERRILSHRPLAKWWLCCSEVDGTRGADCDPGRREIRWKRQWSCFLDDENEGKWMGLHLAKTYFRVCSIKFASDLCIGAWI